MGYMLDKLMKESHELKGTILKYIKIAIKELKVNIPENEVDRILKEYKKIKRKQKSNFSQIKKLVDKNGRPL